MRPHGRGRLLLPRAEGSGGGPIGKRSGTRPAVVRVLGGVVQGRATIRSPAVGRRPTSARPPASARTPDMVAEKPTKEKSLLSHRVRAALATASILAALPRRGARRRQGRRSRNRALRGMNVVLIGGTAGRRTRRRSSAAPAAAAAALSPCATRAPPPPALSSTCSRPARAAAPKRASRSPADLPARRGVRRRRGPAPGDGERAHHGGDGLRDGPVHRRRPGSPARTPACATPRR